MRHFLDIKDFSAQYLLDRLNLAVKIKQDKSKFAKILEGKTLAMIFQKPSLRTRVSFEIAMKQLGGEVLTLQQSDTHLGKGEPISDMAQVLSRMVDIVGIRCFGHEDLLEFAKYSKIPLINALTNHTHPCQIMAAMLTFMEKFGSLEGLKLTWVGDWNNVLNSYIEFAQIFGKIEFYIATPAKFKSKDFTAQQNIVWTESPIEAVTNADVVITDTWVSMGDIDGDIKKMELSDYQINSNLMKFAKKSAIFSHCLPAHRGEEVSAEVIDGQNSIIFDEAENRIHAQKAIILGCLGY
jgi:ornithine carbamoyltransferase